MMATVAGKRVNVMAVSVFLKLQCSVLFHRNVTEKIGMAPAQTCKAVHIKKQKQNNKTSVLLSVCMVRKLSSKLKKKLMY